MFTWSLIIMASKQIEVCHAGLGDCVTIHFIVISTPSHAVIPSGARNLIIVLRAGSGRNLYN
jgi:hypothetical protein